MSPYKLDKGRHSVFTLHYHLILVVKYRRKALYNEAIRERLKNIIYELTQKWENENNTELMIEIVAQEPGIDHHHILFRGTPQTNLAKIVNSIKGVSARYISCLLYTSDAADDLLCVDLGGRRIIKKKKKKK